MGLYWLYYCFVNNTSGYEFLNCFFTISFWIEHKGAWFVAFLIPLYFITPFLGALIDSRRHRVYVVLLISAACLFVSALPFDEMEGLAYNLLTNIQYVVRRMPCFLIGYSIAPMIKSCKRVRLSITLAVIVMLYFAIRIFNKYVVAYLQFNSFYAGWLLGLLYVVILCLIFDNLKYSHVRRICYSIGTMSLESYLVNYAVLGVLFQPPYILKIPDENGYIRYCVAVIIGIPMTMFLHKLCGIVTKKLKENNWM